MEQKDIRKFFPHKCILTKELINTGSAMGENLLKTFLPEELWSEIFWGLSIGNIGGIKIKTEEEIIYQDKKQKVALYLDSHIKEEREIIFELK